MGSKIVVLDPGHGGRDPGALGNGLREKDIVLDIGLSLRGVLSKNYECKIIMTRSTDVYVDHATRCRIANNANADIFVSLHVNSASSSTAHGFESFVLRDLSSTAKARQYQRIIHSEIMAYYKQLSIHDRGLKQAGFYVLRYTRMPAILFEYLFIVNPNEAKLLRDNTFLQKTVEYTAIGIAKALNLKRKIITTPTTPTKEVDEVQKEVYLVNGLVDSNMMEDIIKRRNGFVIYRGGIPKELNCETLYVIGGSIDTNLKNEVLNKAKEIVLISGRNRRLTGYEAEKYFNR